eukprot:5338339-Alexandrium_andersonii.AAC.1
MDIAVSCRWTLPPQVIVEGSSDVPSCLSRPIPHCVVALLWHIVVWMGGRLTRRKWRGWANQKRRGNDAERAAASDGRAPTGRFARSAAVAQDEAREVLDDTSTGYCPNRTANRTDRTELHQRSLKRFKTPNLKLCGPR